MFQQSIYSNLRFLRIQKESEELKAFKHYIFTHSKEPSRTQYVPSLDFHSFKTNEKNSKLRNFKFPLIIKKSQELKAFKHFIFTYSNELGRIQYAPTRFPLIRKESDELKMIKLYISSLKFTDKCKKNNSKESDELKVIKLYISSLKFTDKCKKTLPTTDQAKVIKLRGLNKKEQRKEKKETQRETG